jgi:hypothetical protein
MKNRSTLILGLISIGLLFYVYFDILHSPSTDEQEGNAWKVTQLQKDEVEQIEITNGNSQFVFVKKGSDWQIQKPVNTPADSSKVNAMLSSIEYAKRIDTLKTKNSKNLHENLVKFGLTEPQTKIVLKTKSKVEKINFGKSTAVPGAVYAYLEGENQNEIIVVDQSLEKGFDQDLNTLRSHDVLNTPYSSIKEVVVRKDQQEVKFKKNEDGSWTIEKPIQTTADPIAVSQFLSDLMRYKAISFVAEDQSSATAFGLNPPNNYIQIITPESKIGLKIGGLANNSPQMRYASLDNRTSVFTIDSGIARALDDALDRIRDKRIVSFRNTQDVEKFSILYKDQQYNIERDSHALLAWKFSNNDQPLDGTKVEDFLKSLLTARATSFLNDSDKEISSLDKPQATIQIFTDSQQKPDEIKLGSIYDQEIITKCSRQNFPIKISKLLLEKLPEDPYSWLSKTILPNLSNDLYVVLWQMNGKTFGIQKDVNKEWGAMTENTSVDQKIINLQLKVLNDYKAEKWLGKYSAKDFEKSSLTLTLKYGHESTRLTFGEPFKNGNVPTRINDEDCIFETSKRDYDTLCLNPFLPNTTPTPTTKTPKKS